MRRDTLHRLAFALRALVMAACVFGAAPAFASGGGGGGGGGDFGSSGMGAGPDPAKAYQEGVAALNARDYAKAASKFRIAANAAPNDPTVNYAFALALIGNGDERAAKRPLERIMRADGVRPDARFQLGLIYLHLNQRDKADGQLQALASQLSACDAACGDIKRLEIQTAHDALKKAMDAPATPAQPTTGWLLPPPGEGRSAYAQGVGLVNQARYAEALDAFTRTELAIGPHPDVLNYLGFVSRKLGRFETAERYYHAALSINPDHKGANEYLGELYLQLGRNGEARTQLAKLDVLCPYGCAEREELVRWMSSGR